jgi:hypothetical protein
MGRLVLLAVAGWLAARLVRRVGEGQS